jgi:hypothetical protein
LGRFDTNRFQELNNYSGLKTSRKLGNSEGAEGGRAASARSGAGGEHQRRRRLAPPPRTARPRITLATIRVAPSPTGSPRKIKLTIMASAHGRQKARLITANWPGTPRERRTSPTPAGCLLPGNFPCRPQSMEKWIFPH